MESTVAVGKICECLSSARLAVLGSRCLSGASVVCTGRDGTLRESKYKKNLFVSPKRRVRARTRISLIGVGLK